MGCIPLNGPNFLRRLGRHLIWGSPTLYRPVGIARRRGDCRDVNYDLWIDGFPRSANTFAVKSLVAANPTLKIRSHHHIPAFVIQSLRDGKPGMLMLRKPEDAVISWAIFWQERVDRCLDYYVDFHRGLERVISRIFIAEFHEVTTTFDAVIERFNTRFGTGVVPVVHNAQTAADCFAEMDRNQVEWRGFVDEMRVPRPSSERAAVKVEVRRRLRETPSLARKLLQANDLYSTFLSVHPRASKVVSAAATQQLPTCS